MDPLSIATSCISLTCGITKLTMRIYIFVSEVRNARKDMDAVARELTSLHLSLGALKDDDQQRGVVYPEPMRKEIHRIILNCDVVVQQMNDLLIKLSSGRLGRRIQWAMCESEDMNKLRSSLESNKSALEAALTVGTITMLTEQRQNLKFQGRDIAAIKNHTKFISSTTQEIHTKITILDDIKQDTAQINDLSFEISELRQQLDNIATNDSGNARGLRVFIEQTQKHTASLLDPFMPLLQSHQNESEANMSGKSSRSVGVQTTEQFSGAPQSTLLSGCTVGTQCIDTKSLDVLGPESSSPSTTGSVPSTHRNCLPELLPDMAWLLQYDSVQPTLHYAQEVEEIDPATLAWRRISAQSGGSTTKQTIVHTAPTHANEALPRGHISEGPQFDRHGYAANVVQPSAANQKDRLKPVSVRNNRSISPVSRPSISQERDTFLIQVELKSGLLGELDLRLKRYACRANASLSIGQLKEQVAQLACQRELCLHAMLGPRTNRRRALKDDETMADLRLSEGSTVLMVANISHCRSDHHALVTIENATSNESILEFVTLDLTVSNLKSLIKDSTGIEQRFQHLEVSDYWPDDSVRLDCLGLDEGALVTVDKLSESEINMRARIPRWRPEALPSQIIKGGKPACRSTEVTRLDLEGHYAKAQLERLFGDSVHKTRQAQSLTVSADRGFSDKEVVFAGPQSIAQKHAGLQVG